MIEHIEYFKTTDEKEFESAEEALTHELKTNKDVMKFKLVGYDKYDDEPYWEILKDKSLKALAEDIWVIWYESDYVYIENKDAFNFVANLVYLIPDKDKIRYSGLNSFEGVGWYEIGNNMLIYMNGIISSWREDVTNYELCSSLTKDEMESFNFSKKRLAELEDIMKNLNKFI